LAKACLAVKDGTLLVFCTVWVPLEVRAGCGRIATAMPGSQTYIGTCFRQLRKLLQWAMEPSKGRVMLSKMSAQTFRSLPWVLTEQSRQSRRESHPHTCCSPSRRPETLRFAHSSMFSVFLMRVELSSVSEAHRSKSATSISACMGLNTLSAAKTAQSQ